MIRLLSEALSIQQSASAHWNDSVRLVLSALLVNFSLIALL